MKMKSRCNSVVSQNIIIRIKLNSLVDTEIDNVEEWVKASILTMPNINPETLHCSCYMFSCKIDDYTMSTLLRYGCLDSFIEHSQYSENNLVVENEKNNSSVYTVAPQDVLDALTGFPTTVVEVGVSGICTDFMKELVEYHVNQRCVRPGYTSTPKWMRTNMNTWMQSSACNGNGRCLF